MTGKFATWCATLALALPAGGASGQSASGSDQPATAVASLPTDQADVPPIRDRKDKISYAFGVDLGRDLSRQKSDLNLNLLMRALTDTLAGKQLLMTEEEAAATVKQTAAEQKQDSEHAKAMISERNRREGEAFFTENAKKEGVVTLPSGLQYKILNKGAGKNPGIDDRVVCNYRGTLVDGTEFDSSYRRNQPMTLPVKGIMPGWTQALQLMSVGSKWQIFIPPQLAYGDRIVGGIGPNAMLTFEVELLSIEDAARTVGAVVHTEK